MMANDIQINYKTRMIDELVGLTKQIALLEKVIYSENAISKDKLELMHKQLDFMYGYHAMLIDRIHIELQ